MKNTNFKWISILILVMIFNYSLSTFPYSTVTLTNQRYNGIIISFSPDISEDFGKQLVPPIKVLFTKASKLLQKATHNMASFGNILIVVPNWWSNASGIIDSQSVQKEYHQASVRIDDAHPVHGDNPYTLQSQGCGEGGNYIHLTPAFLIGLSTNGKQVAQAARIVVRNWIQFRYGVFPETGSSQQLQFPLHYSTQDGQKPTGCTNAELQGIWRGNCAPGSKDCSFTPNERQDTSLTTSLMSWPELSQIDSFCDKTNHNPIAPTIHNALCHSRSVWEVMYDHSDFVNNKPPSGVAQFTPPTFQVIRNQIPNRFVIVIDSSQTKNKLKLSIIRAALSRLVMLYLPDNAQMAIIHYSDKLKITKDLTRLDTILARNQVRRTLPMNSAMGEKAMMAKALKLAIESFFTENGGNCIVISLGKSDYEMRIDETIANLRSLFQSQLITLTALVFEDDIKDERTPYQLSTIQSLTSLASATGGYSLVVNELSDKNQVLALAQFDGILQKAAKVMSPGLLQIDRHLSSADLWSGEFFVDDDGANEMTFAVTFEDELWPISLTSPSGYVFHAQHDNYNDHKELQLVTIFVPLAETGKWTYNMLTGDSSLKNNLTTAVTVTSVSRKTKPIELHGWVSIKKSNVSTWPIIIYGHLTRGSNPIINAQIKAIVNGPITQTILLYDVGNGDPDILKDDGVYSRYVPGHLKMGFYSVWLMATDNGTSQILEKKPTTNFISHKHTGPFQRMESLGSFYVGHSGDVCPPSRVADLRFLSASRNRVHVGWTEPGDDFDTGRVIAFHFWWSEQVDCLVHLERACGHEIYAEVPVFPKGAGIFQTAIILLPPLHTRVVYIALTAEDSAHNLSPTSNVIAVFWNQVQPSLNVEPAFRIQKEVPGVFPFGRGHCNARCLPSISLAVITVGTVVISLMVIAIVIAFCLMEYRRRLHGPNPSRPRLDIIAESESERVLPEENDQHFSNSTTDESSNNHQTEVHDPTDVVNLEDEDNEKKAVEQIMTKVPSDDIIIYQSLISENKGNLRFLHSNPNCTSSHSNITKCACDCHVTINNPIRDLYV